MNTRLGLLGSFTLSLLLTGCPLNDHYQLLSQQAAGETAGADDAGTHSGGAGSLRGGSGGASAGAAAVTATGEAGEPAISGAPNGGALGADGGAGNPTGGADKGGGGAGLQTVGGGAGASGGSACAPPCTATQTCCTTGCADLTTSDQNCGACGSACNAGRGCASSVCKGGWLTMALPPTMFVARSRAAIAAIGKSVFFWGGQDGTGNALDTGAIYYPAKNTWKYLPKDPGAPSARMMASAVWTGKVVIVYGGTDTTGNTVYRDGSVYDLVANSWAALPAGNPSGRSAPFGYWDGTRAIFWGGLNNMGNPVQGADRFDLATWSLSTSAGDPGAINYPAAAFDGSVLYLMGGQINGTRVDKAESYSASSNRWTALTRGQLNARSGSFGTWEGSHFVVWGGRDDNGLRSDGQYLSGTKWTDIVTFGAPSARYAPFRRSGWCFPTGPGVFALLGGQVSLNQTTLATNGGYYSTTTSQWTAIPSWLSGEEHEYGMGVWTGQEFVLWGGRDNNGVTSTGERWAP